jgi:MFS family permease
MRSPARGRIETRPIVVARAARGIADGFVSVLLAQYLTDLGFSGLRIGVLVAATLIGSAALTLYVGLRWSHIDPRRILLYACGLMALTGVGFASTTTFALLFPIALVGTMNPTAGDVSVFLPVDQAAIADRTTVPERPTRFAHYNIAGGVGAALGALASPLPHWLADESDLDLVLVERWSFVAYVVAAGIAWFAYRRLTPAGHRPPRRVALGESRAIVIRLAALFSLDSAAGGLVINALLVLYLHNRFGLDAKALGVTFAATSLCSSFSQLVAPPLARRIGLVRTMVFTHLPANVFLVLAGLAPTAPLAIGLLLARSLLSSMDVPVRQALVMRLVPEQERAAAASVTNVPRSLASALTPLLAGLMLDRTTLGLPLILAGLGKITYDLLLLAQPLDRD